MPDDGIQPQFDSRPRHMVRRDSGGWTCMDCLDWFAEWPSDLEPCPAAGDKPHRVAMGAATEQFRRMPSSNCWDYARAVVAALREAGMIVDQEPRALIELVDADHRDHGIPDRSTPHDCADFAYPCPGMDVDHDE